MLKFYTNPLSPFAQKVQFFLEEAKVPHQVVTLDLKGGEQKKEDFLRINSFGQVPAIELNGFSLSESNAILRYVADRYELTDWYPRNLEDRAQIDRLMEFSNIHVNRWLTSLIWNLSMATKMGYPSDPRSVQDAQEALGRTLPKLEAVLAKSGSNLFGATLTLADAVLMPFLGSYKKCELTLSDYPCAKAWADRMVERPAWKKVLAGLPF